MTTIAIVDYGMGNFHSVARALKYAAPDADIRICSQPQEIAAADRVVFPGQGAMRDCMRHLDESGLREAVLAAAKNKPFLGICVGEQMLFAHSDEGNVPALGVFPGNVVRFPDDKMALPSGERLKVPHMGWNEVRQVPHALWNGIDDGARFYFVHSYFVQPADPVLVAGTCEYGVPFTCAVGRDNIFAVQFHPEKSARDGLQLLKNFVEWHP